MQKKHLKICVCAIFIVLLHRKLNWRNIGSNKTKYEKVIIYRISDYRISD